MDSLEKVFDQSVSKDSIYTSLLISQKYGVPQDVMRTYMKPKFSKQFCRSMHPIVLATYNYLFKHNKVIVDFGECTSVFQSVAHYKYTYKSRMRLYRMCMLEVFTRTPYRDYWTTRPKVKNILGSIVEIVKMASINDMHICAIKVCVLGCDFNKYCTTSIDSMFRCPIVYIQCNPLFSNVIGHAGIKGPVWYTGCTPCEYMHCYLRILTINLSCPTYLDILLKTVPSPLFEVESLEDGMFENVYAEILNKRSYIIK